MTSTYQLSASLLGHSQDIRALSVASNNTICSASRDTSVITWTRPTIESNQWDSVNHIKTHRKFVNAIAFMPPNETHPQGLVLSAGQDKVIQASDPFIPSSQPVYMLNGHTENVCALTVASNGDIISGSWDTTSKVWRNWKLLYSLEGHEGSVWAVLSAGDDLVLTGCADKKIRLFKNGRKVHIYNGHTDVVRGLAWLQQTNGFVSASNDASLRIWSLQGECLKELQGHTAYIYCVAVLPSGEIISSSEDSTVNVWKDGSLIQNISHPCTSVWTVAALPNGDIASGGSDSMIRVFTRRVEAFADTNTVKEFNEAVARQAIPSNVGEDVDKSKLPGLEALNLPGDKEGQVIMVRNGNLVEAHQWDQSSSQWIKVGEVLGSHKSDDAHTFAGKKYDHVFDVDIADGKPPLKLPYNIDGNPYLAAQEFIERNGLSQTFLEQIANFIIQNAKSPLAGSGGSSTRSDPFTGEGRYIPEGNTPAPSASSSLIPQKEYLCFKVANVPAIFKKIQQFNDELANTLDLHLDASSMEVLSKVCKELESIGSASSLPLALEDMAIIEKMVFEWPNNKKFPAIDLLRLCIAYSPQPAPTHDTGFVQRLLSIMPTKAHLSKEDEANLMLTLRLFSNMHMLPASRKVIAATRQQIFVQIKEPWRGSTNVNLRLAFATLLLNTSVHIAEAPDDSLAIDLIPLILEFIITENDSEAVLRALAALGTMVSNSTEACAAAKALETPSQIIELAKRKDAKFKELSRDVANIISS